VKPASFSQMIESGWHDPKEPGYHYGFGLFVHGGGGWVAHGGVWVGYRTYIKHFTPTGITVAIQTNQDDRTDMVGLTNRIAELASVATD